MPLKPESLLLMSSQSGPSRRVSPMPKQSPPISLTSDPRWMSLVTKLSHPLFLLSVPSPVPAWSLGLLILPPLQPA